MSECKGKNCKAKNGFGHSEECIEEHDMAYDTPGNRNPGERYRGYKNEPLDKPATDDQKLAWEAGKKAREV